MTISRVFFLDNLCYPFCKNCISSENSRTPKTSEAEFLKIGIALKPIGELNIETLLELGG